MDQFSDIVGENIRRLRGERALSLEGVAKLTGVSSSMLSQIERGDVNPTITTVWKIANGLKVPFATLVTMSQKESHVTRRADLEPLLEDDGRVRNFPMFPFDAESGIEVYMTELDSGGCLTSEAHAPGTEEMLAVQAGRMAVRAGGQVHELEAGDFIRFNADVPHSYENPGSTAAAFTGIIRYAR